MDLRVLARAPRRASRVAALIVGPRIMGKVIQPVKGNTSKGKPGKGKMQNKLNSLKSALTRTRDAQVAESNMAEANVVELLPPHAPVTFSSVPFGGDETHEINTVLHESLLKPWQCNRSCAGSQWVQTMLEAFQFAAAEIQQLVECVEEQKQFWFGNGGVLVSRERIRLPVVISIKWCWFGSVSSHVVLSVVCWAKMLLKV